MRHGGGRSGAMPHLCTIESTPRRAAEFLDRISPSVYRAAARHHYEGPAALVSLPHFGLNVGGCRFSGARQTFLAQRGRESMALGPFYVAEKLKQPGGARGVALLMRHGETPWNREGRVMGRNPVELDSHGRAQVAQLVDF